jgi:anaerobic selenocysteine-containing dehydrogenase
VWAAELAHRLGLAEPESLPNVETDETAELPAERPPRPTQAPPAPQAAPAPAVDGIVVVGYRQLMSGAEVDHAEHLEFQRRRSIELAHDDAQSLGVATGDRVTATWQGGSATGPALVNRRLRSGVVRLATAVPHVGPGSVAAAEPEEPVDA